MLGSQRCVVITHQKGRNTKENVMRNFGCAHPEGYRKALRLMRLGEKFGMPVISLIDTPGAFPGIGSEERHICGAIAVNLREMMKLRVPVIAAVIGEGGSGGALGIGVADRVLIFENAYYSVISPEACSAILWRDRRHAAEAAEALKLTAQNLLKLEVVDEIVPSRRAARTAIMILPLRILEKRCAGAWSEFLRFRSRNCWRNDIRNFAVWVFFGRKNCHGPGSRLM